MTSDLKGISLLVFAIALFLGACSEITHDRDFADPVAGSTVDFNYKSVRDGRIRTLHEMSYEVEVNGNFALTKTTSRVD